DGRDNGGQGAPGGPTNGTGTPPALCNGGEIDRWAVGNGRGIRSVRLAGTGALRLQLLGPHVAGPNNQFWGPDNDIAIEDIGLSTGPNLRAEGITTTGATAFPYWVAALPPDPICKKF